MIILGIHDGHNASAALMVDGCIVGLVQEERFSKRKNQTGFPLHAIRSLIKRHLGGNVAAINRVSIATRAQNPFWQALDRYSDFSVQDHVREMHEYWYPRYYRGTTDAQYWVDLIRSGTRPNRDHNFDLAFLTEMPVSEVGRHFNDVERQRAVTRHLNWQGVPHRRDHHTCHAYYAAYGGQLPAGRSLSDALVVTADAWGDDLSWSVSIANDDGRLQRVASGDEQKVARIYKFVTLILGMRPNEHEYKVMGLAAYGRPSKYVDAVDRILSEALDFRGGRFVSDKPLRDSYFDLKNRLEGHRFDCIAAGLQSWANRVVAGWISHWLQKTGKRGLCFSGGLSMNVKTNGYLLELPELDWISVPASGGDESLSAGACFLEALEYGSGEVVPMEHVYLGDPAENGDAGWIDGLCRAGADATDFGIAEGIDTDALARCLAGDLIIGRCVDEAEFGARSLGNRAIIANAANPANIKVINDAIKSRDFWMPFAPSILAEHADRYLLNAKGVHSPFMTIGFDSKPDHRAELAAGTHAADHSVRPQMVSHSANPGYWSLLEAFRRITGRAGILNTSLNLHGEPMCYSVSDAARTMALSQLEFLALPGDRLLYKRRAEARLRSVIGERG